MTKLNQPLLLLPLLLVCIASLDADDSTTAPVVTPTDKPALTTTTEKPPCGRATLDFMVNSSSPDQIAIVWQRPFTFNQNQSSMQVRIRDFTLWINKGALTDHTFVNVEPDTTYTIETRFCSTPQCCGPVTSQTVTTNKSSTIIDQIPQITGVTVTQDDQAEGTFDATWTELKICDEYQIQYCVRSSGCVQMSILSTKNVTTTTVPPSSLKVRVSGIADYTTYNVFVRCLVGDFKGKRSEMFVLKTKATSDIGPVNFTITRNEITANFAKKLRDEAPNPTVFMTIDNQTVSTSDNKATFSGLTSATMYKIEIKWCANNEQECGSTKFEFRRTESGDDESKNLNKRLPMVKDLQYTAGVNVITLTWNCRGHGSFEIRVDSCNGAVCSTLQTKTVSESNKEVEGKTALISNLPEFTQFSVYVTAVTQNETTQYQGLPVQVDVATLPNVVTGITITKSMNKPVACIVGWARKNTNIEATYQSRMVYPRETQIWKQTTGQSNVHTDNFIVGQFYTFEVRVCTLDNTCYQSAKRGIRF